MINELSKIIFLFFLSTLLVFDNESFSLTNHEIRSYCRKSRNYKECFQYMKMKRKNMEEGKAIEIPVIPFRKY